MAQHRLQTSVADCSSQTDWGIFPYSEAQAPGTLSAVVEGWPPRGAARFRLNLDWLAVGRPAPQGLQSFPLQPEHLIKTKSGHSSDAGIASKKNQ